MEHFFLHFLAEVAKSIIKDVDGLFEKSLKHAVPDLELLREEPQKVLDHNEFIIGPRRRYFSRILAGLAIAFAGVGAFLLMFSIIEGFQGQQKFGPVFWRINSIAVALCCFALGFRFSFRGGYCFLMHDGVEFRYRKKVVRCSWRVFHASGQRVYLEESNLLLLPISPDATDCIMEIDQDGHTVRNVGLEVHTPQWDMRSLTEAALKPFYVVKIEELADLLLQVGGQLGTIQSSESAGISLDASQPGMLTFPLAHREKDGWIQMNLTNFHFPPYCCICAVPTAVNQLFQCPYQDDSGSGSYQLQLPACRECSQRLVTGKKRIVRSGVGLTIVFMVGAILTFFKPPATWLTVVMFVLMTASLIGSFIMADRLFPAPARVRYSTKKGTFRVRFRNPDYEEMLLAMRVSKHEQ